jgi:thioredoxin reductase (NADPH)
MDKVLLYGASWCRRSRAVSEILGEGSVPFTLIDPDLNPEVLPDLMRLTKGRAVVPVVKLPDGRVLVEPCDSELAEALGITLRPEETAFDVAILGGGPAGLTAAIYCSREAISTVVFEKGMPGGQAALTALVENYPGFPEPINGFDLTERMSAQAARFGTQMKTGEEVTGVKTKGTLFRIETAAGGYFARSLILATGAVFRRLGVPGEDKLLGRGVSFCATCDAPFYKGKPVVVVGGGNSAFQETLHLAHYASKITIIELGPTLGAAPVLVERVKALSTVDILLSHRVTSILGEEGVTGVCVADSITGEEHTFPCEGVFVFIGQTPNTAFLKGFVELDSSGFIRANPANLATSVPGVFAAGDARSGSNKQISAATGEGTVASFMVSKYLDNRHSGCAVS